MKEVTYATIVSKAKQMKKNVEKKQDFGDSSKWGYYIAKAILTPKKNIRVLTFDKAVKPRGDYFSTQLRKASYLTVANWFVQSVEKNKRLPDYIKLTNGKKIKTQDCIYLFIRVLVYYNEHKSYPAYANLNSKAFVKPTETTNEVYNYFIDVFGNFGNTIDGALKKIAGRGYGYYYDDMYSNKEAINRMNKGKGVNCTDSCHVFYNIMLQLIALKKYKKVECLHIQCSGGDGHVRLRITMNDGTKIYRDPAAVLDSGDVTHNWCSNGSLIATDPSWFLENLHR